MSITNATSGHFREIKLKVVFSQVCETQDVSQTLRQILLTLYYFILESKIKKRTRKGNSSRAPVNPAVQFDSLILFYCF